MNTKTRALSLNQSGFTLVELLITTAIIGILGAIAITTFAEYKENALFSKAQSDLRNARTALEAGLDDLAGLGNMDESSVTTGGALAGNLATALPAMLTSDGVMLRLVLTDCGFGGKTMVQMYSYACQPELVTWYLRTCGDFEINMSRAPAPGIC